MHSKELTDISILNSQPKVDILWEPPSENLRKLKERKVLVEQKKRLSAWILVLALLGIILMVIHTEVVPAAICEVSGGTTLVSPLVGRYSCFAPVNIWKGTCLRDGAGRGGNVKLSAFHPKLVYCVIPPQCGGFTKRLEGSTS